MVLLRCYGQYRDFVQLANESGLIKFLDRMDLENARKQNINGLYTNIGDFFAAFYRVGPQLFFRLNEQVLFLNESVTCTLKKEGEKKTLSFFQADSLLLSWTYDDPVPGRWEERHYGEDPTPMVSEEDFDLGLLVKNVMSSQGRKKRIFPDGLIGPEETATQDS